ncbi:hypothetical protein AB4851_04510 [Burkholderia sp. 22PA0099]|uniref:hypothetical protein n=1 Tax=Burkholderia sp. 22PA0099 TaxID=3237372 RepID=UPI0039C18A0C
MQQIDELYLAFPFAEAWMLARLLRQEGDEVGRAASRMLRRTWAWSRCTASLIQAATMRGSDLAGMKLNRTNQVNTGDLFWRPPGGCLQSLTGKGKLYVRRWNMPRQRPGPASIQVRHNSKSDHYLHLFYTLLCIVLPIF